MTTGKGDEHTTTVFVAPTERHPAIKKLGTKISTLPEQYGCDILWRAQHQWWGVQRKEIKDFIASIVDGRLAKELGQMRGHVALPLVVIEGRLRWSTDDVLIENRYGQTINRQQFNGMLFSITAEGANVFFTEDTEHTAQLTKHLILWSQKESHNTMQRRPGPQQASAWGKASNHDWARHLLQGFPGIGNGVADAIIKHFGRVPLTWDVTVSELIKVPGVGKVRARQLLEALETKADTDV